MASEVVHGLKVGKYKGLILKIDFEKAFDTIEWNFLFHLLEFLNFDSRWMNWLKIILNTSKTSILINGVPTSAFSPSRGLRKGDPLSTLLFNLVVEVLHQLLLEGESLGIFKVIKINEKGFHISHLQYADDTIIFLNNVAGPVRGIKYILQIFHILTGLKVNVNKSTLYGFNEYHDDMAAWASILNCMVGSGDIPYLGANINASSYTIKFWDPLVTKFQRKLASWKINSTTQACRLVLLKAALDSFPIYWLNLYRLPKGVETKIDVIRKTFFWGQKTYGGEHKDKLHLLRWLEVCKPKEQGGLGVYSLQIKNSVLLFKWWWRARNEADSFWNEFLSAKCGNFQALDFASLKVDRTSSSSIIKDIQKAGIECDKLLRFWVTAK